MNIEFIFILAFIISGILLLSYTIFGLFFNGFIKSSILVLILSIIFALLVIDNSDSLAAKDKIEIYTINIYMYVLIIILPLFLVYFYLKDKVVRKKENIRSKEDISNIMNKIEKNKVKLNILKSDNWLEEFKNSNGELYITDNIYGRKHARIVAINNVENDNMVLKARLKNLK